jgi:hypothetical protein
MIGEPFVGAGGATGCVVTVPKGSTAHIVVFEKEGVLLVLVGVGVGVEVLVLVLVLELELELLVEVGVLVPCKIDPAVNDVNEMIGEPFVGAGGATGCVVTVPSIPKSGLTVRKGVAGSK